MAGASTPDVASSPRVNSVDHASIKKSKPKRKKEKKSKKPKGGEVAVLAHADDGAAQPPPAKQKTGNRDEAEKIRQQLGIKRDDAKSAQTRVGFQFSFAVAETAPDTDAGIDADADMQTNIDASTATPEYAKKPQQIISEHETAEPSAQEEAPARHAKAKPSMQPDESGFIPRRVYIGGMPFWYTEEEIRQCWTECGEIADLTMLTFPDSGNFRGIVFITFATQEGFDAALNFDGDDLDGKRLVVQRCKAPVPAPGAGTRDGRGRGDRGQTHEGSADAQQRRTSKSDGDGVGAAAGQKRGRAGGVAGRGDANGAAGQGDNEQPGTKQARKNHDGPPGRVKGYNVLFVGNIPWELSRGAVTELFEDFHPKLVRMFDKPGTRQHKGFAHVHFADEEAVDKAMSMNGASVMGRKLKVMYAQPSKKQTSKPSKRASEKKDVIEEGI